MILAARPSVGKSTLGLNMAMANAKAGQTCAIFSLEMTADQLAIRALAGETGIDSHRIRLGLYTQSQEQLIINAIGELSELPIYIDDTPYQGMVEIRGKARRLDLDRGVDLIMVDYLQLVQGQHRGGPVNRVQEITEISRALKVMAGELNTAVIACSQMSRMVENRPSHRPQLSDLRDSGSIEQDADIVAFIHREDLYTTEEEWSQTHPGQEYPRNIAEIIVAKNRKGPTVIDRTSGTCFLTRRAWTDFRSLSRLPAATRVGRCPGLRCSGRVPWTWPPPHWVSPADGLKSQVRSPNVRPRCRDITSPTGRPAGAAAVVTGEIVGKVDLFAEGLGYLEWGDLSWPGELPEFLERLRSSARFRQVQFMPSSRMEDDIVILSAFLTGTASIHFLQLLVLQSPRLPSEHLDHGRSLCQPLAAGKASMKGAGANVNNQDL